ncbi:MAG: hypothetical protein OD918_07330 [Gammaproteobacteria bacterium]
MRRRAIFRSSLVTDTMCRSPRVCSPLTAPLRSAVTRKINAATSSTPPRFSPRNFHKAQPAFLIRAKDDENHGNPPGFNMPETTTMKSAHSAHVAPPAARHPA